jgi:YesN/AraC family two-component response regulator
LMEDFGFVVVEAANGREALELYQGNPAAIDLVVTDVGMPIMDGYDLVLELKKLDPELPILISSGFGDADVGTKLAGTRVAGMISKPYSAGQLREALQKVVPGLPGRRP